MVGTEKKHYSSSCRVRLRTMRLMEKHGVSNVNDLVEILSDGNSSTGDVSEVVSRLDKIEALVELNHADLLAQKSKMQSVSEDVSRATRGY